METRLTQLEQQGKETAASLKDMAKELHGIDNGMTRMDAKMSIIQEMASTQVHGLTDLLNRTSKIENRLEMLEKREPSAAQVDIRLDSVAEKLEATVRENRSRLDKLETKLETEKGELDKRITSNRWMITFMVSLVCLMIALLAFVGAHVRFV